MYETTIKEITKEIHNFALDRNVFINKIVLFGSEALGEAKDFSDIDIIVVSKDFNQKSYSERINKLLGLNRNLVKLTNRPFDILYYSDTEWDNSASPMIYEAKLHGRIVYS
ncbi:MAG: nucleotidyltransferase domain-containing protein [bacterium]